MDNIVLMTIINSAPDLSRKLPRNTLTQSAVTYNIVEHLSTVDVLEHHVVMMLVDNHLAHPTDVRVIEQHGESSFSESTDLFRGIFRRLLCC